MGNFVVLTPYTCPELVIKMHISSFLHDSSITTSLANSIISLLGSDFTEQVKLKLLEMDVSILETPFPSLEELEQMPKNDNYFLNEYVIEEWRN